MLKQLSSIQPVFSVSRPFDLNDMLLRKMKQHLKKVWNNYTVFSDGSDDAQDSNLLFVFWKN